MVEKTTISDAGAHAAAALTDRIPASKAGAPGYLTPAQLRELILASSSVRVLAASAVGVAHTGDTLETVLATIAIPAGAMGANGILRVTTQWDYPSTANNKTLRVKLGATAFSGVVATTTLAARVLTMIHNRGAENSQIGGPGNFGGIGVAAAGDINGVIDTAVAQNLTITAQLALGTETIRLEAYLVELINGTL